MFLLVKVCLDLAARALVIGPEGSGFHIVCNCMDVNDHNVVFVLRGQEHYWVSLPHSWSDQN